MKLENVENDLAKLAASALGRKGGKIGGTSKSFAKRKASKQNLIKANKALKKWRKDNCK